MKQNWSLLNDNIVIIDAFWLKWLSDNLCFLNFHWCSEKFGPPLTTAIGVVNYRSCCLSRASYVFFSFLASVATLQVITVDGKHKTACKLKCLIRTLFGHIEMLWKKNWVSNWIILFNVLRSSSIVSDYKLQNADDEREPPYCCTIFSMMSKNKVTVSLFGHNGLLHRFEGLTR